ncbi:MAG: ATP-binding protein [Chloroflexi bacterium]|nr:ATP-binding protein [Chloroflexota bacterium]
MESLGDILKRLGDTRNVPTEGGRTQGSSPTGETAGERGAYLQDEAEPPVEPCEICSGRGWFTAEVPAGHPDFGRVVTCQCQHERVIEERTARLLRYSNIGHLSRFTFDSLDPDGRGDDDESRSLFQRAHKAALEYAESVEGWLVLTGPTGSGKTHLAAAIANRCIESGQAVFFAHVPDLLDHLRSSFGPASEVSYTELFDQVRNTPLLVLDGLEARSSTPWAHEKLQQIVNHRFNAELPTVVTTADDVEDLDSYLRTRLQNSGSVLSVSGKRSDPVHRLGNIEPELLRRMTFENFDVRGNSPSASQRSSLEGALEFAKNYAADPHGWLTLFGSTGAGKTHLAVAIAAERVKAGEPVFFAFVPELLDYLRYTFTPDSRVTYDRLFDEVKGTRLLLLDDLGTEHSSPWAEEKLYQIIVHRHNGRLPTVITSSLDFTEQSGPISSRIRDPYVGEVIRVDAPDYRIREREPASGPRPHTRRRRSRS